MANNEDVYIALIKFVKERTAETGVVAFEECQKFILEKFQDMPKKAANYYLSEVTQIVERPPRDRGPQLRKLNIESYFHLLEHEERKVEAQCNYWRKNYTTLRETHDGKFIVIYNHIANSEVCNALVGTDGIVCVISANTKLGTFSVRSVDGWARKVAVANGGGGHPDAAGFSMQAAHINYPSLNIVWPQ